MFDRKLSDSLKGVAIMLMLLHHLFTYSLLEERTVNTFPFTRGQLGWLCSQFKICVGIFVFLTAFGMTRNLLEKQKLDKESLFTYSVVRYIKLEFNFLSIYLLGFISYLIIGGIIRYTQLYNINNNLILTVLYIIIDAAGLSSYLGTPTLNVTWWYMSIAYFMIFLIPIFVLFYRKAGKLLLIVCLFLGVPTSSKLSSYFLALIIGIWAAEENIFEKLYAKFSDSNKISQAIEIVFCLFILLLLIYFRGKQYSVSCFVYLIDGICPLLIGFLLMMLKDLAKSVISLMSFFGKYSMNIFLLHTFIYYYFFPDFIYRAQNWVLIFLILFGSTLLLSILVEIVKKKIGFYILVNTITQKIEKGKQNLYKPE